MPLQMRLPKRGFKNPNRIEYVVINLSRLQEMLDNYSMTDVSVDGLYEKRFIQKNDRVKVLGNGELTGKVNVTVHAISKTAQEKIESNGGTVTIL
jgi:large subunit ribosomal protein L15